MTNENFCTALTVYVPPSNNKHKLFKTRVSEIASGLFAKSKRALIIFYFEFLLLFFIGAIFTQSSYSLEYWFSHTNMQMSYILIFALLFVVLLSYSVLGSFFSYLLNALFSLYSGTLFIVFINRTILNFYSLFYIFLFGFLLFIQILFFSKTLMFSKFYHEREKKLNFKKVFSHLFSSVTLIYIYSTILLHIINYLMLG